MRIRFLAEFDSMTSTQLCLYSQFISFFLLTSVYKYIALFCISLFFLLSRTQQQNAFQNFIQPD